MRLIKLISGFLIFIPFISSAQMNDIISFLEIYHLDTGTREVIYKANDHFEAPNWTPDGSSLIYNSHGLLYIFQLDKQQKQLLDTDFLRNCNNDHGISMDGNTLIISNNDEPGMSRIYKMPFKGGKPKLLTQNAPSYWHGISPDGTEIAYVANRNNEWDIYTMEIGKENETQLTSGGGLDDGPDYSPDGKYIYYNSFSTGNMEIWRIKRDGSNKIQLTNDPHSNWFPHPSPDGNFLVYISYLKDQGDRHPAMKEVALKLMDLKSGEIRVLCKFTGGQGSINVPSWSPDSKKFAFVSYQYKEK